MRRKIPLTRQDKEKKVIELAEKGWNIRNISKKVHMSFGDIGEITRKQSGKEYGIEDSKKYSKHSQALELFRRGESNLSVAIKLGLSDSETIEEYMQFMRLAGFDRFCEHYNAMKDDMDSYVSLHIELKNANLTVREANEGLDNARHLDFLKSECGRYHSELQDIIQQKDYALGVLDMLRQQRDSLIYELKVLNQSKDAVLNQRGLSPQPGSAMPSSKRRVRRRIQRPGEGGMFHGNAAAS